jgi:protein-tyrosine phosphatase
MMPSHIESFVDIHTHILPGIDDGPADLAGSLAIARCYQAVGVRKIVATPHFLPGTAWAPSIDKVLTTVAEVQTVLLQAGIDLELVAGMEIAYHTKLEERILGGAVLPLGKSGTYLIEPSFQGEQDGLLSTLEALLHRGIKLILAHPERVDAFQRRPQILAPLISQGLQVQVNSGSLLGYFGEKSRDTAEQLRQSGSIHFIASDAHDHARRRPLSETEWHSLLADRGHQELLVMANSNLDALFANCT